MGPALFHYPLSINIVTYYREGGIKPTRLEQVITLVPGYTEI